MREPLLMTPGPTRVPEQVARAASLPMIHHRSADFSALLANVMSGLKRLMGTSGDVFIAPASGRGAMEACIVNLFSPGDEVVAFTNGAFGEMFARIAAAFGLVVHRLGADWEEDVDPQLLAEVLGRKPNVKGVLLVHCETAVARDHDVRAVAQICRERDVVLVVDAVSSLGGVEIRMDGWGVDAMVSASQKCLMCPAGLAVIAVGPRAWDLAARSSTPKSYWSFSEMKRFATLDQPQTPWSTPVSLVRALGASLAMIFEEGPAEVYARHRRIAATVREGLTQMGFRLFPEHVTVRSSTVTAAHAGTGIAAATVVRALHQQYGVVLARGQGKYVETVFRVGHMGDVREAQARATLDALARWRATLS